MPPYSPRSRKSCAETSVVPCVNLPRPAECCGLRARLKVSAPCSSGRTARGRQWCHFFHVDNGLVAHHQFFAQRVIAQIVKNSHGMRRSEEAATKAGGTAKHAPYTSNSRKTAYLRRRPGKRLLLTSAKKMSTRHRAAGIQKRRKIEGRRKEIQILRSLAHIPRFAR